MLPSISKAFSIPPSRQQVIISTYSVASGSSMLLWGRVADVHGRWGVFLAGATLFSLFTLLVPFAPSELFLYTLSGLQGFSSAATVPSGIGILASTFPPGQERNRAFVAMIASSSVGSVLGNIAGGAIGGLLSWKWGFWIPASMAGVVALAAFGLWPGKPRSFSSQMTDHDISSHARSEESVDYIGGVLITASLALLQIGLSQGNANGWANLHVPGLVCASILLGGLFVSTQLGMERKPNRYPLVRLSTFKNPRFSAAFVVVACFFGSFNSFLVYASML
jgi:MFS family permease